MKGGEVMFNKHVRTTAFLVWSWMIIEKYKKYKKVGGLRHLWCFILGYYRTPNLICDSWFAICEAEVEDKE